MTVRLFSPRRAVWRLGRRCLVLHSQAPDWRSLFGRTLDLMIIAVEPVPGGIRFQGDVAAVVWRTSRLWTLIEMDLTGLSPKKRVLVMDGLVKAARYHQLGRTHAERQGDSGDRRSG